MELLPGGELSDTVLCGGRKVPCQNGQEGCIMGKMDSFPADSCTGNELPFADIPTRKKYIAETGLQLLRGVQYIHSRGVGHRDLKPQNVMVVGENCVQAPESCLVKIIDFGLSCKVAEDDPTCAEIAGTPFFISP